MSETGCRAGRSRCRSSGRAKVAFARILEFARSALRHPAALGRLEQTPARDVAVSQLLDIVGAGALDQARAHHTQTLGLASGIYDDGRGGVSADVPAGEFADLSRSE